MTAGRKSNANKKDWNTPPKYITPIKQFFGGKIDLDPCSNHFSLVEANTSFIYPTKDGLVDSWDGDSIFVNPPYGRQEGKSLYHWFQKGVAEHKHGKEMIFLVPVATNTKHFKEIVFKKFSAICFLSDTRLRFYTNGSEDRKGAPMACCLCYLGHRPNEFSRTFTNFGKVFLMHDK